MSTTHTETVVTTAPVPATDDLAVATLRFLAADMVEEARSGHPGLPLGAAPMAWVLFSRHLRHDPSDSSWPDRDRFVLSAGHGSALLYAMLHVFGYDLPMDELRRFRQLGSATPGHPEYGHTDGVETTTGPLGQGLAMAVGMAVAERMQHARYPEVTDHHTYALVGDGCLMEGISQEAISMAGHLGLGRLVVLWDDNRITIDGPVGQASSDDQQARFAASGWHVQTVEDGTDLEAIDAAITAAKADPRPSLVAVRTVIGHGAPGIEGTPAAHGAPLGPEVLAAAKAAAGWSHPPFTVPEAVAEHCARLAADGRARRHGWSMRLRAFAQDAPERAERWRRTWARDLPPVLDAAIARVEIGRDRATRQSSQAVLAALTAELPELVGGSADLAGSTGTAVGGRPVTREDFSGTVLNFGIRELGMAAVLNGMSLHGGFRVYGSTFLVFSDYLRPALRLSALMRQPVVYLLTHDSVAVGEDGPTHQPVEHVESLRLIPGLTVLRPADDVETAAAWRQALATTDGPTAIVLTRQAVPSLGAAPAGFLTERGGRVVRDATSPDVDVLASGSEVALAVAAAHLLADQGVAARVISVPWRERYTARSAGTPRAPLTVSVEAGVTSGWAALAGVRIGVDRFGASGKATDVLAHVGLTPHDVATRIRTALAVTPADPAHLDPTSPGRP